VGRTYLEEYNIVASTAGCDLLPQSLTNLLDVDPLLGVLTDNGGPTVTHAPLDGSPAIDGACASSCPEIDQRGAWRWQGKTCDIGAVERLTTCGNGVLDEGEDCDAGIENGDDCCSSLCRFAEILFGDCNGDGRVAVEDLIRAVAIAVESRLPINCRATDRNGDLRIDIGELIRAIRSVLDGAALTCLGREGRRDDSTDS
jgi:cysteine-rich repeat protein